MGFFNDKVAPNRKNVVWTIIDKVFIDHTQQGS